MAALMELVFRGLPTKSILSYFDDILVATPDVETHLEVLEKVFEALSMAGLKLHPNYTQTHSTTLVYSDIALLLIIHTEKPRFNESEGTKDFVLYSRGFVIPGAFYYKINYRGS
jgi:hypothetical protein